MTRRIVIIIAGALAILGLMFLLWFWFFSGSGTDEQGGTFGTGEDATRGDAGSENVNNENGLGEEEAGPVGTEIQDSYTPYSNYSGGSGFSYSGGSSYSSGDYLYVPGAVWLDGSYNPTPYSPTPYTPYAGGPSYTPATSTISTTTPSGGSGGGAGVFFDPTDINEVDDGTISGKAYFQFDKDVTEDEFNDFFGFVDIAGLFLSCAGEFTAKRAPVLAINKGASAVSGLLSSIPIIGGAAPDPVYDAVGDANATTDNMFECVIRSLAQAAIQTITAQTVNWINSGFEGKPAFVQNFGQFFNQVAEQAAGDFLSGSALSFLCSPFQADVRIALATSYAQRNSAPEQTCSLSDAVSNVEGFAKGNFADGGWPGLISFTTEPSNNPFGAFVTAQARLNNQILFDTAEAERKVSDGGFISKEECDPPGSTNCKIVTPGSTIESALETTMQTNLDSLGLADSITEILSALANQLLTKTLYEGLSNLNAGDVTDGEGKTPAEKAASKAAGALLKDLKTAVNQSEKYGAVQRGSIEDIQAIQSYLTDLQNCWIDHNNTTKANDAAARVVVLEKRVTVYNNNILQANKSIARVEQLQSQALSAKDKSDIEDIIDRLENRQDKDRIYTKEDVTTAQQDRDVLQREMDNEERLIDTEFAQCNAS
ncbi:MAG: hypothetical protein KBD50_03420 [Candidatus Pacebacteria bacterium]|nr:hypothetical protein [Candidatus Paceibacterota bacterium]